MPLISWSPRTRVLYVLHVAGSCGITDVVGHGFRPCRVRRGEGRRGAGSSGRRVRLGSRRTPGICSDIGPVRAPCREPATTGAPWSSRDGRLEQISATP
ncbi:hypothetical protein STXM2123_1111 [Streptomyces sp. F-3]|nr:hypothetical protein STXM2123_1111 [Streptomyces sp. F-3]